MISSLAWVRKGAASETPQKVKLTDEEFHRISEKMGIQLSLAKEDLADAEQAAADNEDEEEDDNGNQIDDQNGNEDIDMAAGDDGDNKKTASVKKTGAKTDEDDELAIYNLDTYDEEGNEDADGIANDGRVSLFSNVRGLAYHTSNKEDPYIELGDDEDDELEEMQDMVIAPTDNLIVAAKTEDDISHLEIYVYEEDEDNLFVHHDILLPSFPLCLEWLDFPVGSQLGSDRPGNYIAVGTFEPQVEIWNLDLVDSMFPDCILGEIPSNKGQSDDGSGIGGGKKKKKKFGPMRTARRPNADYHIDAVMAIAWNTVQRNLIATGSADTTVKLWDLNRPSSAIANYTMPHNNKVQAVCWNKAEPAVLLTGGYDQRVCAFDSRAPDTVAAWKLTADVECLKWDPLHSERFMVSTEDGIVKAFDVRTGGGDKAKALFTLQAHDSAVSALDISPFHDGLMVTGSADKNVKIWSIKDNKPACIVSRDVDTGKVFSANFSPDSPYLVSLAGSKGRVVVWNLETNGAVRRAYPPRQHGQKAEPKPERKEITIMEPDDEPDEDEANLQLEVPVHDEDIGEADEDDDAIEEDDE